MSKLKWLALVMIFTTIFVSGCTKTEQTAEDKNINSVEQLNDSKYTIAAIVGAASEPYVGQVFPKAEEKQFSVVSDMFIALDANQVDGVVFTKAQLETVMEEQPNKFKILEPPLGETEIHMVISPNTKITNLKNEINEFLAAKKADGTLDKIYKYWMIDHKMEMPEIPAVQNPDKKLVVGTFGTTIPSSFYVGDELAGFDIEIVKRFAAEYGYEVEFRIEDATSMLADTEFGKVDMMSGSIMYTDERAERVIFPETPMFTLPISVMVRDNPSAKVAGVNFDNLQDLNDSKYSIAAVVGAASEPYVGQVFPNAKEKQFPTISDMVVALESRQADAIVFTRMQLESVVAEKPNEFKILDTPVGETELNVAISPNTKITNLKNEINEFLAAKKADGTLDRMYQYWLVDHKTEMPEIPVIKNPDKKLVAGTIGSSVPTSFYANNELVGFDVEITKRFAAEYGYEVEFRVEDIPSLLNDTEFGKLDMISGSVMYTDERAERVIFPETPLYAMPVCVMVRNESAGNSATNLKKAADFNDSKYTIGVITGSDFEDSVAEVLPKAKIKQFATVSDLILALEQKQIDVGAYEKSSLEDALKENPGAFKILDETLIQSEVRMVVSPITKIHNLENQLDEFVKKIKSDGTLDKMYKYWIDDLNTKMPNIPAPENPTQTVVVGILGNLPPYNFYANNELSGFDIEFMKRFANEYNYNLEYRVADMVSQLAEIEFGKLDMLCGAIVYTDERAEHVNFVKTPLFTIDSVLIVRNEDAVAQSDFFSGIAESFNKTLIREDRYKMILDGLKVTLILSIGSLILGTILGFIFCMLRRSSIKIVSTAMQAFIVLISGLPMVLTLMICFYIVFSGTGLNEIVIAIIAFSIDFGCYIAITLNSGIESVAAGEIEAAAALGMSNWQIYKKIIFPQAIRNIFGVYNRQVISLIKATSIVGYIAVQDLTKVSDIIRARTYEAFFSLIFTAAIYFIIARICVYLLSAAEKFLNRRRKNVAK